MNLSSGSHFYKRTTLVFFFCRCVTVYSRFEMKISKAYIIAITTLAFETSIAFLANDFDSFKLYFRVFNAISFCHY